MELFRVREWKELKRLNIEIKKEDKIMKVLYHYTSTYHLPKIMKSGYLKLTDSNLKINFDDEELELKRIQKYNEGNLKLYKPVVWLTDSEIPNAEDLWLYNDLVDKTCIKITVKKRPHHKKWSKWSKENNIDIKTFIIFKKSGNYKSWWVSERIIKMDDFLKIENLKTGEIYLEHEAK
ncbi:hypothetical protein SDC9_56974 [bioreactor metagenome]|uniref:Uncharacterized protein n=1 Tax=bioreactor metagenome TaxID=1076179 RepID=A0A644X463_9ZZZZ